MVSESILQTPWKIQDIKLFDTSQRIVLLGKKNFLIFDFNHKKIFFTNSKKTSNEQIITKHGINFKKLDSGEIIVSYLRKKSTFDKLGVIIGDKVLSVNNIDCSGLNDCDCKYLLNKEIKKDSIKINFIAQGVLISSK